MTEIVPAGTASDPVVPPRPIPADRLAVPLPPAFDDPMDERRHRRERLVTALRAFGRLGFEEGVSGHVTARDPVFPDHYWVNPLGMPFDHLTVGDLLLVDERGAVVQGARHVNQAAFALHARVHAARPDVVAVAHAPSPHGRTLAALGRPLEPISQQACAFYEDHAVHSGAPTVVLDRRECDRVAEALGRRKALLLRHRGLLTVGDSVDAAAWWFVAMERCCGIQLAAAAAGEPVRIGHEEALRTRDQLGGDLVAWLNFQPLRQQVLRDGPDLLDDAAGAD